MTHFITSKCTNCGQCQEVCAVQCIVKGEKQSFIDPDTCIDCGACIPECPEMAIKSDTEITPETQSNLDENTEFFSTGPGYKNQE